MKNFKEFVNDIINNKTFEGLTIIKDKAILNFLNDNEELISVNHSNWKNRKISSTVDSGKKILHKYIVHFGLIGNTDVDAKTRKNTMDLVKSKPEMISMTFLVEFLKHSIKKLNVLKGVPPDYLAYAPSRSGLNERLTEAFKQIFPEVTIIQIKHIHYPSYASQINSDSYMRSFREPKGMTKKMLDTYSNKPNEEDGIHIIRKSNTTSSKVIQRLNPKYAIDPTKTRDKVVPIADAIKDVILNNKTMLIIDDNLHLGLDFRNIFKDIENILFNVHSDEQSSNTIKHRIEGYVFYRLTNDETNPTDKKLSEKSLLDVLKEIYYELKKEYNGGKVTPEMISYISDIDISKVRSNWGDIVANNRLKNNTQQKVDNNGLKNNTQQKADNTQQKLDSTINASNSNTEANSDILNIINRVIPGTNVEHTRFGKGKVIKTDGDGVHKWATISFPYYHQRIYQEAHIHLDFVLRNGKLKILD